MTLKQQFMKQRGICKQSSNRFHAAMCSGVGALLIVCSFALITHAQNSLPRATDQGPTAKNGSTCTDGIDNDGDGRADYYGTDKMDPDPACFSASAEEVADDVAEGSLVPCTNKCGLRDVFVLLNNVLKFVISKLLIPLFVVMIMFIGYQYLMAQGRPGMHAKLKKMLWHMVIGLVLILGAWLIVKTLLSSIGYSDGLLFFD